MNMNMEWYGKLFRRQPASPARKVVAELTEFELSETHKILLKTDNMVEGLLQHISEQQQLIRQYEEELGIIKSDNPVGKTKIIEKGSTAVS